MQQIIENEKITFIEKGGTVQFLPRRDANTNELECYEIVCKCSDELKRKIFENIRNYNLIKPNDRMKKYIFNIDKCKNLGIVLGTSHYITYVKNNETFCQAI